MSSLPALPMGFRPPIGTTFRTKAVSLGTLSHCLCRIASFIQNEMNVRQIVWYEDWWQHDGCHFEWKRTDIHGLFAVVGTGRTVFQSTPGDTHVHVGVAPLDGTWYLRYRADWNEDESELVGGFDLTLPEPWPGEFRRLVIPQLGCAVIEEPSIHYFARIMR